MPKSAVVAAEPEREDHRRAPSWLPDWTLPAGYLSTAMRPTAVAWQGLRRNRDFGDAWIQLQGVGRSHGPDRRRADAFSASEGQRFGVERLADPSENAPPRFLRTCARVFYALPGDAALSVRDRADGGRIWIRFDAALPTREQLDSVSTWFSRWAADQHRAQRNQRQRRLPSLRSINLAIRVHDAFAVGATPSEIGKILFMPIHERHAEDLSPCRRASVRMQVMRALKTAIWLIDEGGYLDVALRERYRPDLHDIAPPA